MATSALGLAIAVGALVVTTTAGETGQAGADEADPAFYADITGVAPNVSEPPPNRAASTGTFTVDCGRNEEQHFNPDNFIAQPGVRNGAQHLHDYVGNLSTDADSTNESLLAADTTCGNGDKSAYFWPVLRIHDEEAVDSSEAPSEETPVSSAPSETETSTGDENELPGNEGEIQRAESVELTFHGSPVGPVRPMPKFLRVLYGDAKVSTNGPANARPSFTCTGFEDRLIDRYPICPPGSKVQRVHIFPSCWDGRNTDSANHRTHIVHPRAGGRCPRGFVAVPQLRITLTYDIPHEVQVNRLYTIDSFPEEEHNPASDHDDFANVMSNRIMNRLVACVNRDRTCQE